MIEKLEVEIVRQRPGYKTLRSILRVEGVVVDVWEQEQSEAGFRLMVARHLSSLTSHEDEIHAIYGSCPCWMCGEHFPESNLVADKDGEQFCPECALADPNPTRSM